MGRVTSAAAHLSVEEIALRLKGAVGSREHRRWLIVWNALVDPRSAKEIAKHTGVAENTIHDLMSRYRRFGARTVEAPRLSKRRRCYLSKEEEVIFLSVFGEGQNRGDCDCSRNQTSAGGAFGTRRPSFHGLSVA